MDREELFSLLHEIVLDSDWDADMKIKLDDFVTILEEGEE
jgi:hypothetical protein